MSKLAEVAVEAGALLLEVAADLGLKAGVGALVTCVRDIDTLAEAGINKLAKYILKGNQKYFFSLIAYYIIYFE